MNRFEVLNLVIETTRRCNMRCPHCLRGSTQNVNIPTRYIDEVFKRVSYVGTLTVSG